LLFTYHDTFFKYFLFCRFVTYSVWGLSRSEVDLVRLLSSSKSVSVVFEYYDFSAFSRSPSKAMSGCRVQPNQFIRSGPGVLQVR
jgi:hypothetical protein